MTAYVATYLDDVVPLGDQLDSMGAALAATSAISRHLPNPADYPDGTRFEAVWSLENGPSLGGLGASVWVYQYTPIGKRYQRTTWAHYKVEPVETTSTLEILGLGSYNYDGTPVIRYGTVEVFSDLSWLVRDQEGVILYTQPPLSHMAPFDRFMDAALDQGIILRKIKGDS